MIFVIFMLSWISSGALMGILVERLDTKTCPSRSDCLILALLGYVIFAFGLGWIVCVFIPRKLEHSDWWRRPIC